MSLDNVLVHHRSGRWCPGVRHVADVVAYDMTILPEWRVAGRPNWDRAYLLLEEGVQLVQPVSWVGALAGAGTSMTTKGAYVQAAAGDGVISKST